MKKLVSALTLSVFIIMFFVASDVMAKKEPPYTVGVSNGLITHSWRTQMIDGLQKDFYLYKGQGLVDKLLIQHSGFDVGLQIQQIRNLVNAGCDLILINPNSQTALNPVIEEAMERGVLVIVIDQIIKMPDVLQIGMDQVFWMQTLAKTVFEKMGNKGDIIYLSGYDGAPACVDRDYGMKELLKQYPDINLLAKVNGNWDPTTAQQAMADVLAAYPKIDGIVSQDGQCLGVVRAFKAANRDLPVMNADAFAPFLKEWIKLKKEENFAPTLAMPNGPGFPICNGLGIGVRLLQGKELKPGLFKPYAPHGIKTDTVAYVPLDENQGVNWVTNANVEEEYEKHVNYFGIADYLDGWWSQEKLDSFFK